MIEKQSVEIDGTKVFYIEARPNEEGRIAPTVLLVHGFLTSSASWEDLLPGLAREFRVVALDLPGQGESDVWKNMKVSFARYASFLNAFCNRLGIKNAALVGHSMGGGIAIVAASMYRRLFSRAVFIDAVSYPFPQPLKARLINAPVVGPFLFKKIYGWGMFRSYFKNDVFYDRSKINERRLRTYYDQFNLPLRREFAYNLFKMISAPSEVVARVPDVALPVLVVWGGKDKLIPLSCGHRLAGEIKGAKIEIIPNSGHAPHEEMPEVTLNVLQGFLRG